MTKGVNPETGRSVRFKDRTGQRNGRLIFTKNIGENAHRHQIWEAVCDCGVTTTTTRPHETKSCGCLQKELASARASSRALPDDERQRRATANQIRQRQRRKTEPLLAMQARLSRLHRHALAQVGAIKTSGTFDQLGYSPEEFVHHIERQFSRGMGWHNMRDWQIDHIIPVSTARDKDDVIALNQLSNLRPMWATENNSKKDKILVLL